MEAKLEFTLKQDSPMIHFQGETSGAILRASEVKPKLDRFLAEWCKKKEISDKGWKTDKDKEHNAYDYKMRIFIDSDEKKSKWKKELPSYFGKFENHKMNLYYRGDIHLEILCFHKGLRNVINEAIETFFVLHNFGTRQNRGIGGFSIDDTTAEKAEAILLEWYEGTPVIPYKIDFSNADKNEPKDMLACGNMYYQILKSGINIKKIRNNPEIYIKSYLTEYFLERGIGGEKRWMKENEISPAIGKSWEEPNNQREVNDYRFIRGLLGAAGKGNIGYISELDENGNPVKKRDDRSGKDVDKKERILITSAEDNGGNKLERIPSPIRYKLIEKMLFIIPLEPDSEVYGKKFVFINKDKRRDKEKEKEQFLQIPLEKEFCMQDLLEGYLRYLKQDRIREEVEKYADKNHITLRKPEPCKGGGQP